MTFFDTIKKSLGIINKRPSDAYEVFELTFTEEKLGMGINKYSGEIPLTKDGSSNDRSLPKSRTCPLVTKIEKGSQAEIFSMDK